MTELNERIEGEIQNYEPRMLEKIKQEKRQNFLKKAKDLMQEFEDSISIGYVSQNVSGLDSGASSKECVKKYIKLQIELLNSLKDSITHNSSKKTIQYKIEDLNELLGVVDSIVIEGI